MVVILNLAATAQSNVMLSLTGTGTTELGGTQVYTGATTVSQGTLANGVANALSIATCIANGATTSPSPPSPSTTAVEGDSWMIRMSGTALMRPASHKRT